jgi:hypothetical protein
LDRNKGQIQSTWGNAMGVAPPTGNKKNIFEIMKNSGGLFNSLYNILVDNT